MKGTAPRRSDIRRRTAQREWLRADPKNHAEHVMIVDLLRNDLGRICLPGPVRADTFRVETYPTLFQMTSTVTGTALHTSFADLIAGALSQWIGHRRTQAENDGNYP